MPRHLTRKQEAFAQAVIDGHNQSDAYRLSYDADASSPATIWQRACELAKHPRVAERIEALRSTLGAARQWHRERLVYEAALNVQGARDLGQYAASNGAIGLVADLQGMRVSRVEHTGTVGHLLLPGISRDELRVIVDRAKTEALELGIEPFLIEGESTVTSAVDSPPSGGNDGN